MELNRNKVIWSLFDSETAITKELICKWIGISYENIENEIMQFY